MHDLAPVLSAMREERRYYIGSEEADLEFSFELPVAPAVAWQYCFDPIERQRWACRQFGKDPDEITRNAEGRNGTGTKTHCGHGPEPVQATREFVDWRPFSYCTARTMTPVAGAFVTARPAIETMEFVPIVTGTRIVGRFRLVKRGRIALLALWAARPIYAGFWRRAGAALVSIVEEDEATLGGTRA